MDFGAISGAVSAISAATELAKAALSVRDANALAATLAQMKEKLLDAQQRLFTHNTQLLQLQQEHFEATQKLRELNEALSERARYALFQITPGNFVYRLVDVAPVPGAVGNPRPPEPEHYVCQPCFEKGVKAVLGLQSSTAFGRSQVCPVCSREIYLGGGQG